jgi:hypothetical protein
MVKRAQRPVPPSPTLQGGVTEDWLHYSCKAI